MSGRTSRARRTNRAIVAIAFTPRSGWRAVGGRAAGGDREPGAAALCQSDLQVTGLADDARVLVDQPAVPHHLRAVDAADLLVGGEVVAQRARRASTPARRIAAPAASAAAIGPFMSHAPRPIRRRLVDDPVPRRTCPGPGVARGNHIEVAVPGEVRAFAGADRRHHARTARVGAERSRGPAPRAARTSAATAAAASSVPPGFSDRAAISARARRSTSSGSTASTAAATARRGRDLARPALPWRPMVPVPDVRSALRAALEPDPRPRPRDGDRLAAVLAPLVEQPEPALVFTRRAADLSRHAGEISFPGGLQDPGETLIETALRESREEIDLDPADVEIVGALPPVPVRVELDPGRSVRGHDADAAGVDAQRRRDRRGPDVPGRDGSPGGGVGDGARA